MFSYVKKLDNIFILTLKGTAGQFLLNPTVISSIRKDLAEVKAQSVDIKGPVLVTVGEGDCFCGGFDFRYARPGGSDEAYEDRFDEMMDLSKQLVADLISFPMPTVAAINGNATSAGLILAMAHDYATMSSSKGLLYASELDMEMTLPDYFTALIRSKVGLPSARRLLASRAMKLTPSDAKKMGIIETLEDSEEGVVEAAKSLAKMLAEAKWNGEVYAEIRKALYPEVCNILGLKCTPILPPRSRQ